MERQYLCAIIVAGLLSMTSAVSVSAGAGGVFVEHGIGIRGDLELGMLYKRSRKEVQVVERGGIADQLGTGQQVPYAITLELDHQKRIVQMVIRDPHVLTEKFIRVTSSARDVLKAYGLNYSTEKLAGRVLLRYADIGFEIRQDTDQVAAILIYKAQ